MERTGDVKSRIDGQTGELERLRRELALHRAAIACSLDPFLVVDVQGTVLFASDSVEREFGWPPAELVGRNVKVLMSEPHSSQHDGYLAAWRRTGVTSIIGRTREFDVRRRDGTRMRCDLSVSKADLPDGRVVLTGTFRDVTERRRNEELLRDSEQRFHAIFDEAFQYLGLLAPDGRMLEANRTALEAASLSREDAVGRPFWETRWWSHSREAREKVRDAVQRAARGEFVRFEVQAMGRGGAIEDVDFSLKPVKDADGRVVLLIPEGRNISELKRAQRTETSLLRALAEVGESAAVLVHEIKNPVTGINVALRAVADKLGADQREVIEDLASRMRRLEQLLRGTLSFARPLSVRRAPIDAARWLALVVARQNLPARARISVQVDGAPRFQADPELLEEVFSNLIANAVEAREDAHIVLSVAPEGVRGVLLAVDDDGPGVPEALRVEVLKPFVTTKQSGTGLGLAICRRIAEEHGGTLEVARSVLGGARISFHIPASRIE